MAALTWHLLLLVPVKQLEKHLFDVIHALAWINAFKWQTSVQRDLPGGKMEEGSTCRSACGIFSFLFCTSSSSSMTVTETLLLFSLITRLFTNSWDNYCGQVLFLLVISHHCDFFSQVLSSALLWFVFKPVLTPKPLPALPLLAFSDLLLCSVIQQATSVAHIDTDQLKNLSLGIWYLIYDVKLSNKYFHLHVLKILGISHQHWSWYWEPLICCTLKKKLQTMFLKIM